MIKVLDKEVSELIAAGEVIERPASVIKELVENSIDAGAKHITVEIKNGGATYMRVSDDGCGIAFNEVPTAFLRHATSKINSKDDLEKIYTLGFRGEALASVAAVSKVEVLTKQKNDEYGTVYRISGSFENMHDKSGCPNGTTIIIRDIFYNVPARAKFMKKDVTEANAVSQTVQKMTLSHPEISFKMIRDNRTEFNSSGDGELYSAVYAVFGKDFANDLIPVNHEYNNIRVHGYTVKPLYSRSNRTFQNFFVNGRYVHSKLCSSAVESAYENLIMTGKFPACILMIEMSAANMDVNIHPAKAEVRFTDEKDVSDAVFFAIKNSLVGNGLIYEFDIKPKQDYTKPAEPEQDFKQQEMIFTPVENIEEKEKEILESEKIVKNYPDKIKPLNSENHDSRKDFSFVKTSSAPPADNGIKQEAFAEPEQNFRYINQESLKKLPENNNTSPAEEEKSAEFPDIKIIGEAFGLYVICQSGDKMIIIDKHAAHERILFERLKSRNCRQYSQKLLTPIKILLTSEETDALENNIQLIEDMGFEFDFSEKPCVNATAVPTFAIELDIEEIIQEIAENFVLCKHDPKSHTLDDILHTVACKAAIKANDKNTPLEMQALAEQVCNDEKIRHCPHGRPVMFTMTKYNIDHQFRRT